MSAHPLWDGEWLNGRAVFERLVSGRRFTPVEPTPELRAAAAASDLAYIPQRHQRGCVVAALAMVTRRSYDEWLARLNPRRVFLHGTCWLDALDLLRVDGHILRTQRAGGGQDASHARVEVPAIADVRVLGGPRSHAVVVLPSGAVLDPSFWEPVTLAAYAHVMSVTELV